LTILPIVMLPVIMAKLTPQQQAEIRTLLPLVVSWVEGKEREALDNGVPLNDLLKNTAMVLGIKQISSVRIRAVDVIPEPDIPRIVQLAHEFGLSFAQFGYPNMPLEQEAVLETFRLLGRPQRFKEKDNLGDCSCRSSVACDTP
jgi:hypothetical protein